MSSIIPDDSEEGGWVITPGGPRPRAKVHQVTPGDLIIHDRAAGTSTVLRAASKGAANAEDQLVITPGGLRPRSRVHEVQPGETVTASTAVPSRVGADIDRPDRLARGALRLARGVLPPKNVPALGSGWITYAAWTNRTGNVISSFRTAWRVPPAPQTQSGQLIYLFNGLQDSPVTHILQQVLQWGISPAGGGNFWAIASWWVDSSGNAFKTPLIAVNEGDILTGIMTLLSQAGGSFSYACEFAGFSGTRLNVQNANQLVMTVETLECYGITKCPDYPSTYSTPMTAIAIQAGTAVLSPSWSASNSVTDCGQHTVVASDSGTDGEVDIYYRS